MVYLPESLHRNLKHLAIERRTSLTGLVREGVETLYREDIEDLKVGQKRLKELLAHPERAISYAEYRSRRRRRTA
jgi:predicted DNA-binding protein